jgi:phospholipase C
MRRRPTGWKIRCCLSPRCQPFGISWPRTASEALLFQRRPIPCSLGIQLRRHRAVGAWLLRRLRALGLLPQVSFVDPRFLFEAEGLSGDDHAHGDIRDGEAFLNAVYHAVTTSPNWRHTVLVITFDEWGGFFEHVPPTTAPIPAADAALGSDGLRGFRMPALVIAPWSPRGQVASGVYDHTSVLKMIEWRWGLPSLTLRDASANNLAEVLDFSHVNPSAPRFRVPRGPFGTLCSFSQPQVGNAQRLRQMAQNFGFRVP